MKNRKNKTVKNNSERINPFEVPETSFFTHLSRYHFAGSYCQADLALDVASGIGYGSEVLSTFAEEVIGCEISKDAVRCGQKSSKKKNLSFFVVDAHKLPFAEGTFQIIASFETIEHLPNHELFLSECNRVLKKNGVFICSTNNRNILTANFKRPLNPFHIHEFNQKEFDSILRQYFDGVELYGQIFLGSISRLKNLVYHTFGFLSVRLRIFSILQPLIKILSDRRILTFLSDDYNIERISNSKQLPGYLIAVCKEKKR